MSLWNDSPLVLYTEFHFFSFSCVYKKLLKTAYPNKRASGVLWSQKGPELSILAESSSEAKWQTWRMNIPWYILQTCKDKTWIDREGLGTQDNKREISEWGIISERTANQVCDGAKKLRSLQTQREDKAVINPKLLNNLLEMKGRQHQRRSGTKHQVRVG